MAAALIVLFVALLLVLAQAKRNGGPARTMSAEDYWHAIDTGADPWSGR